MNINLSLQISRLTIAATLALCTFGFLANASADPLTGQLTDGLTGTPIPHARVQVLGTNLEVFTDLEGRWNFDLPEGHYELEIEAEVAGERHTSRLVNQYVPQVLPGRAHVYTTALIDMGYPELTHPTGVPTTSGKLPDDDDHLPPLDLRDLYPRTNGSPTHLELPANQPPTIRVGRRKDPRNGCSTPIVAIDEMSLDDYVKGVLPPEIGVFRSISGVSEVYKAFAIGAKSYGLYFVLRYGPNNRRNVSKPLPPHNYTWFHIDDTACNQRYDDGRIAITTDAADAVAGKIMVKKGSPTTIDKYEYAASCGKHGTKPEYQTKLVPDKPPTSACAGTWCGHNTCAAHENNPAAPNSPNNRCLVRGICQWGAASWGENGKTYQWMLDHYQPNVEIIEFGGPAAPVEVVLTGYIYTDPDNIVSTGVPGVSVALNNGMSATTNAQGVFTFPAVPVALGTVEMTATKAGYITAKRNKLLEAGATNWASTQIKVGDTPDPQPEPDAGNPGPGEEPDAGDIPDDPADTGSTPPVNPGNTDKPTPPPVVDHPRDNTDPNALGRLVAPSTGVQGGCQIVTTGTGSPHTPLAPALALVLAGLAVTVRKRFTRHK